MSRIPEETLQQILAATDIVDLIGRSVKLRRAGTNWVGLCPFHNEKSPSFNVRPSTNSYHCFGCGAGGNAFRFLMNHEGLTFMEAVKRLGDAAGIRIQEEVWDANAEKEAKHRTQLIRVHQEIADWYHQLLMKSPLAAAARDYLKGRGINSAVAKNWKLGYAPANGQLLRQWATEHQFGRQILIDAGILIFSEERGDAYPRFRDRLMFPIRNDNGDVIAFSGRLLQADAKAAKYLNSPETPIFSKSRVLFGFDRAKRHISKAGQAIVCEGQIDTLMLHEAGFTNAVAGQGTAFTEFHAKALKRQADEIVLCYDSDNAGIKAAEKAFNIFRVLSHIGLQVKIAALPAGEDPDSMIRKYGSEAFRTLLANSTDFLAYQLESAKRSGVLDDIHERGRFAIRFAENIASLANPVHCDTAIKHFAIDLGLPENTLRELVQRASKASIGRSTAKVTENVGLSGRQLLSTQNPTAISLVKQALISPEVLTWLRQQPKELIHGELPGTELLYLLWSSNFDAADSSCLQLFLSSLAPDEQSALNQLAHEARSTGGLDAAKHDLQVLELARLQMLKQRLNAQLKQSGLDPDHASEIQREVVSLHHEIAKLQKQFVKPQI